MINSLLTHRRPICMNINNGHCILIKGRYSHIFEDNYMSNSLLFICSLAFIRLVVYVHVTLKANAFYKRSSNFVLGTAICLTIVRK